MIAPLAGHLGVMTRTGAYGSAAADAGGGRMELVVILAASVRDGRIAHAEQFDVDDEAGALARDSPG